MTGRIDLFLENFILVTNTSTPTILRKGIYIKIARIQEGDALIYLYVSIYIKIGNLKTIGKENLKNNFQKVLCLWLKEFLKSFSLILGNFHTIFSCCKASIIIFYKK